MFLKTAKSVKTASFTATSTLSFAWKLILQKVINSIFSTSFFIGVFSATNVLFGDFYCIFE